MCFNRLRFSCSSADCVCSVPFTIGHVGNKAHQATFVIIAFCWFSLIDLLFEFLWIIFYKSWFSNLFSTLGQIVTGVTRTFLVSPYIHTRLFLFIYLFFCLVCIDCYLRTAWRPPACTLTGRLLHFYIFSPFYIVLCIVLTVFNWHWNYIGRLLHSSHTITMYWLLLSDADWRCLKPEHNYIDHSALRTMWLSAPVLAYVPVDVSYWLYAPPQQL